MIWETVHCHTICKTNVFVHIVKCCGGGSKSKTINQYLSYDKTEPPLATSPPKKKEDNSFNNLK